MSAMNYFSLNVATHLSSHVVSSLTEDLMAREILGQEKVRIFSKNQPLLAKDDTGR